LTSNRNKVIILYTRVASNPFIARQQTSTNNSQKIQEILTDIKSANLLEMHYRTNVNHRIDSVISTTNSAGTVRSVNVTWNFKAFNNTEGNVQVSLTDKSGKISASHKLAAKELPKAIKEALISKLEAKNPTGSHSLAETAAQPEVQKFLTELRK
jgi:ribosome-associated toxin RatA of RatAB toxin-antitoxin module